MTQRMKVAGVFAGVLIMFGVAAYSGAIVSGSSGGAVAQGSSVEACSTLGSESAIGSLSAPGCDTLGGRAYALAASANAAGLQLVNVNPTPDTRQIVTEFAGNYSVPCTADASKLLNAGVLCAGLTTYNNTSTATASLATLQTGITQLPVITLRLVHSESVTSCLGSKGTSEIAYLSVGKTVLISKQTVEPPNTVKSIDGITIILNQQTPIYGYTHGLLVNAVHIEVALSTLVHADVVVASSLSRIGGC